MILRNNNLFSVCLIVFVICIFNVHDSTSKKKKAANNASNTTNLAASLEEFIHVPPMPFITVSSPLVFEGVDYDLLYNLSTKVYKDYYDCHYWFTKCVRDMTNFHTVCVYYYSMTWVNFSNSCQVDLENCKHRVAVLYWKESQGIYGEYGTNYYDYKYLRWYSGDGWDCKYSFRRNVPDDKVNFYYEDEQESMEFQMQ